MRSNRPTIHRPLGAAILLLALAGGCTSSSTASGGPATGAPTTGAAGTARATGPAAAAPDDSTDAWLAVGRKGVPDLEVILASGGEQMFDALPTGVPVQDDWGRLIVARPDGAQTKVENLVVQPGFGGEAKTIDGAWRLPTVGPDPIPVGVSADGRTIVLVEADRPAGAGASRFAILARGVTGPARVISLKGHFDFDALSPDGRTLYLIEHLDAAGGEAYQVRSVDVASGALQDGVVVDKRNIDEQMAGYPLGQLRRADGSVFTLYRGLDGPFIHALNTTDRWALCIDLPATGASSEVAAGDWGLAQSADGSSIYAANATLGLVLEIDPVQYGVRRSMSVTPLAGSGIVLAKFGQEESGPAGRRVVVAPAGKTIYEAALGGILAIDATDLQTRATFEAGSAVNGLAVTSDGGTLYALLADGHIVKLDATTGRRLATVPGADYDRLVAVVPW